MGHKNSETSANIEESAANIDINGILGHLGPLGKWTWIQAIFMLTIGSVAGLGAVVFAITGFNPNHRCLIPQCEHLNSTNYTHLGINYLNTLPDKSCLRLKVDLKTVSTCQDYLDYVSDNQTEKVVENCQINDIVYDRSAVLSSITEDYKMVCDQSYERSIFSSLFSVGRLLGSFMGGLISDNYGRMKAITLSIFIVAASGIGETLINHKIGLGILRVIYGMGGQGCILVMFVLAAESTLPQHSVLITTMPGMGFHVGEFILAIFAYFIRDWKTLQLATHIPALLCVSVYFLVPESARWLNSQGKTKEARKILEKRAATNGKLPIPEELWNIPRKKDEPVISNKKLSFQQSLVTIFSNRALCFQGLNCFFQSFMSFFGYYGTLYSATTLSGDPHVNFMLALLSGIPGTLLYLLLPDRIGRKATIIMVEVVLALSSMTGVFLKYYDLYPIVQIICSMISRLVAGVSVKACLLLLTELFPTPIRNTAVSIGGLFGGVGAVLGLLMEVFEVFWEPLPIVIIGCSSLFAAILVLQLPETRGRKLPETIEDVMKTVEK